jgi:nitrogen regulatory protein P-II 1
MEKIACFGSRNACPASQHGEEGYHWEAPAWKPPEVAGASTWRQAEKRKTGLDDMMTKIEAVIQNSKLEAVKTALHEIGVEGMTVIEVRGHGRQKGHTEVYRGREYSVDLIPKTKIEMVLPDALVEKAEQAILNAARTGKIGDGKIFRSRVDEAIRIRNDERGEGAL